MASVCYDVVFMKRKRVEFFKLYTKLQELTLTAQYYIDQENKIAWYFSLHFPHSLWVDMELSPPITEM